MPMPLSDTAKASRSVSRSAIPDTVKVTLPRSVNFTALARRFSSTLRRRTGSPTTWFGNPAATAVSQARFFASARNLSEATSPAIRRERSKASRRGCNRPAPARAPSTMSVVNSARCSAISLRADDPASLVLAQSRGGQQVRKPENAGERRAYVVGECGEHHLVWLDTRAPGRFGGRLGAPPGGDFHARIDPGFRPGLWTRLAALQSPVAPAHGWHCGGAGRHAAAVLSRSYSWPFPFCLCHRGARLPPDPRVARSGRPIMAKISAAVMPAARNSRSPVAPVDLASLPPAVSSTRR